MNLAQIATRDEWLAARKELLAMEKEFDHERDRLTEARRKLPMVKVEKEYVFDGPQGAVTLRDLFEGRQQLLVYHFMFDPDHSAGCKHCSCVMDNIAGSLIHLTAKRPLQPDRTQPSVTPLFHRRLLLGSRGARGQRS